MNSPTTTEDDNLGLDVISRDVISSKPTVVDKRSTLDVSDTDDDDECEEQDSCEEGAGVAGPKPEQSGTRDKKVRRDGEVRNLSQ
jgi:hypothetical protein